MKNILFVCTGNTCRSPMAQCYFNSISKSKYHAFSRGLFTDSSPISQNAKEVLKQNGIDVSHISSTVTHEDIENADMIFGITSRHAGAILERFQNAAGKVYAMPIDITDPYGCDIDVYKACFDDIKKAVGQIINALGDGDE